MSVWRACEVLRFEITVKNGSLGWPEGASPVGLCKGSSQCEEVPAKRRVPATKNNQGGMRSSQPKVPIWGLARVNPTAMETSDPVIGQHPLCADHQRGWWVV